MKEKEKKKEEGTDSALEETLSEEQEDTTTGGKGSQKGAARVQEHLAVIVAEVDMADGRAARRELPGGQCGRPASRFHMELTASQSGYAATTPSDEGPDTRWCLSSGSAS